MGKITHLLLFSDHFFLDITPLTRRGNGFILFFSLRRRRRSRGRQRSVIIFGRSRSFDSGQVRVERIEGFVYTIIGCNGFFHLLRAKKKNKLFADIRNNGFFTFDDQFFGILICTYDFFTSKLQKFFQRKEKVGKKKRILHMFQVFFFCLLLKYVNIKLFL